MRAQLKMVLAVMLVLLVCGFSANRRPRPYRFPELMYFPPMPRAADNPVTEAGAELGRYLFYDPVLSADRTVSCASCHKQQFAFADTTAFSVGINGQRTRRNTMPLFNLAWYPAFFWDGRAATIEEQVFHPVRDPREMNLRWPEAVTRLQQDKFYRKKFRAAFGNQPIDSVLVSRAIGQFLRTLISDKHTIDLALKGKKFLSSDEYQGFEIANDMTKGNCGHCHSTDGSGLGTRGFFSNNGIEVVADADAYRDKGYGAVTRKSTDNGKFKVPSLRNVALTAPYMHDGRFKTLEEVVAFYNDGLHVTPNLDPKMEFVHRGGAKLSEEEQRKLVAFLRSLTDTAFITDRRFSNPFAH